MVKNKIEYISSSRRGENRVKNQDDTLIVEAKDYFLFVLFDGVSSLSNSIDYIRLFKQNIKERYEDYFRDGVFLSTLMYDVHELLLESNPSLGKSTCSAVYISKDNLAVTYFNIGDSRIYEVNCQYLYQMTFDDALPGRSNVLTKCLGSITLTKGDFTQKTVGFSQGILLCSDGFYSLMEKKLKRYFNILNFKRLANIQRAILSEQKGLNSDDSTYIMIKNNGI